LSLVDALVSAAAEARQMTILHYDGDYEMVAGITGQKHEWIVPRGTAD
jgi:predicted nucleic acid-binding protein